MVDQLLALLAAGVHQLHVTCDAHFHPLSAATQSKYTNTKVHRLVKRVSSEKYKNTKALSPCNTGMAPISSLCLLSSSPTGTVGVAVDLGCDALCSLCLAVVAHSSNRGRRICTRCTSLLEPMMKNHTVCWMGFDGESILRS